MFFLQPETYKLLFFSLDLLFYWKGTFTERKEDGENGLSSAASRPQIAAMVRAVLLLSLAGAVPRLWGHALPLPQDTARSRGDENWCPCGMLALAGRGLANQAVTSALCLHFPKLLVTTTLSSHKFSKKCSICRFVLFLAYFTSDENPYFHAFCCKWQFYSFLQSISDYI